MPPEVFGGESRPSSLLLPCFAACPRRLNIGTDYRGYANGLHTGGVKMPEEVAADAEHDHGWEIVVNGDPHEVPHSSGSVVTTPTRVKQ